MNIAYADIETAAKYLADIVHQTPILTSETINQRTGCQIFFKCENFQRTGSVKFRGAYSALAQLPLKERQKGVLTHSSDNHAQAVSLAGTLLGVHTVTIMADDSPMSKQAAVREYGAEIIFYNRQSNSLEELVRNTVRDRGLTVIPFSDHPHVIAGYGTAAKEMVEETGSLDIILISYGSGSLVLGSAIATKALLPNCSVIGVKPVRVNQAFPTSVPVWQRLPDSISVADEACFSPSEKLLPLLSQYMHEIVNVSEAGILRSMLFLWKEMKIVVEPTGALPVASLLEKLVVAPGARIGILISGGNIDLERARKLFFTLQTLSNWH